MSHATEPWYVFDHYGDPEIRTKADDKLITALIGPSRINEARRIVACVNACAGISTADLERYYNAGGGIDEAMDEASLRDQIAVVQQRDALQADIATLDQKSRQMRARMERLERKRDELLAALESALRKIVWNLNDA